LHELQGNETLRIGVLAFRGPQKALAEWQAHADYLDKKLAPRRFVVVPLTLDEFGPAVAARKIDLAVTNTGHYVHLEAGGRISRIATMRIAGPNGPVDRFGGTAITRADNAAVKSYADLRGKRVAVPDTKSFGGWQVHLREARAAGIDLTRDLGGVVEVQAQDKVVEQVLARTVDAGFVRSDLIESMAAAGKLDLDSLRVHRPPHHAQLSLPPQHPALSALALCPARPRIRGTRQGPADRPPEPAARPPGGEGRLHLRLDPAAELPVGA
jgi:ABC-type phosphate/phosphonate transport system substrate-binding protein